MTVPTGTEDESGSRPGTGDDAPTDPDRRKAPAISPADVVGATCPYLTSSGGSWRVATPSRDHRCAAIDPPAPQSTDKQRIHCLSTEHVECPTFRAARSARTATLAGVADPRLVDAADSRRRPLARTAPILLEPPRLVDRVIHLQFDRAPSQLALIGLMVVAFAIVALTRLSSGTDGNGSPSAAPSSVVAIVAPSTSPTPTVPPPASSSSGPSASPSATAAASFRTTYRVKKGDTLLGIANHFGTTPAKIKTLNGMTSSILKIGQVLKIP